MRRTDEEGPQQQEEACSGRRLRERVLLDNLELAALQEVSSELDLPPATLLGRQLLVNKYNL